MAVPDAQEAGKPARASCAHVTFGEQPACCEATPEVQRDDETPWWMRYVASIAAHSAPCMQRSLACSTAPPKWFWLPNG
jgi:hypothetical protein